MGKRLRGGVIPAFIGLLALVAAAYAWQRVGAVGPALPLRVVDDFPLAGNPTRFDYASMESGGHILWLAHMGDGAVEAYDVRANRVIFNVPLSPTANVRGILAVSGKVYAAAQGLQRVVILDSSNGKRLASVPAGDVDGLAYEPRTKRVFVSDEGGRRDVVIDASASLRVGSVPLGGAAGNTQYDAGSGHIFVAVQTRDELAEIDPGSLTIVRRYPLPGCRSSHSLAIDAGQRAAYIACQQNAKLVRLNIRNGRVTGSGGVGIGVDVLALDSSMRRLYVASESGIVSVYDTSHGLLRIAQAFLALNAHVVAVDPVTHFVYFPLTDVGGRPVIRVMAPQ